MAGKLKKGTIFKLHNADNIRLQLQHNLPNHLRGQFAQVAEKGLKAMRNEMRRNLKARATMRTRTLWRNILYIMDLDGLGGTVGSFNEGFYGHFLEFGTRKNKIKKRPWMLPAYVKHKRKIVNNFRRAVGISVKRRRRRASRKAKT